MSNKKNRNKKSSFINSKINQHKKVGKTLIPPMMQVKNLSFSSWMNNRLAELLWACLVIHVFPRKDALIAFKKIAALGFQFKDKPEETHQWDLTHPQLATLPDCIFLGLIKIITNHPLGYAALRPLLLIESLPGLERWKLALSIEHQPSDWQSLSMAVANTLDHQSQEATDVRWLTILFKLALGQITVTSNLSEKIQQIIHYPNRGDMRSVRPSIRSMEMALRCFNKNETWSDSFWSECLKKTDCIPSAITNPQPIDDRETIIQKLHETKYKLLEHWFETLSTSAVDARHDTIFGFGFYSLALLLELLIGRNRQGLLGRLALKTLTDCRISLAYLISQNSSELWLKFRNFGAGQAKLAFLKIRRN